MKQWMRRPVAPPVRDTDWVSIQTAASGLAPQGPMDPIQSFRVRRIEYRILVDLSGLRLDTSKQGLANLGILPTWARPALPNTYYWVNDSPTSIHPSVCATFAGGVIYWQHQLANGQLVVNRPDSLHGGFELTTLTSFPKEYL